MGKITIKRIKFGTYMKLALQIGLTSGVCFGIIGFILGILGGNVNANIGTIQFTGIVAGIILIVLGPIILGFFAVVFGLLSFIPYLVFTQVFQSTQIFYVPIKGAIQETNDYTYNGNNISNEIANETENV